MNEKELAKQAYENIKAGMWRQSHWPVILFIGLLLIMVILVGYFWHKHNQSEDARLQQAKVMSEQYVRDVNALQNELKINKQNAEMLADFAKRAQSGQVQPVTHFTVQAATLPAAAQQVTERINQHDVTLPPAAIETADRTVITPNEQEFKVDVYKYNGYRNWEWSAGYGQHGGDKYVPIEIQRNFSKDAAVSYEHHFAGKDKGFEIKYTKKTDKLFFLF